METDWDALILNKVKSLVSLGGTIVDVGAHVGNYSANFAGIVGDQGRVISFELNPDNFAQLQKKLGHQKNITLKNVAVSDKSGFEKYYSNSLCHSFGTNIIGYDVNHKKGDLLGSIKSVRLDEVIDMPVRFMKIDVEGAEIKVLRGAEKIINNIQYLIIECHFPDQWEELRKLVIDYKLNCMNLVTGEVITLASPRPYQMFCKNNNFVFK